MTSPVQKTLTFIQYDIPPLKSGQYTVTAAQTVNQIEPNSFSASKRFAVPGNRFALNGDDIVSVFPAPLANGEFTGVMPLVVLKRPTLPWQRTSVFSEDDAPWLAILLFEEGHQPTVVAATAADLITAGQTITVAGASTTGTGALPAQIVSYPNINPLDYGQTPSDPCSIIDLDVDLFSKVCPSAGDLPFLAHIRRTDTYDTVDSAVTEQDWAIVLGNRWPKPGSNAYAYLVSLENMGDLLPDDTGARSPSLPAGHKIRLIVYRTWRFFANDLDEKFQSLCENLNKTDGVQGLSSLQLPSAAPDPAAVKIALENQARGALTQADATALIQNALCLGYTALNHHTRDGGDIVSWCRGPFTPYPVSASAYQIAACPDALLRYDPQLGLFDASYAQAWQLGQLMALQNTAFSVALYTWKHRLRKDEAVQAEIAEIDSLLGGASVFPGFFSRRAARALPPTPTAPSDIADWLGKLRLLKGVPFAALVPDEGMLPVESLRFFHVDQDWVAALIDGAFSIGRTGSDGAARDAAPLAAAARAAQASARLQRQNNAPHVRAALTAAGDSAFSTVTGCLLRSQLVSGWPRLQMNGYADSDLTDEVPKIRMERLSSDVMLCLFAGDIQSFAIHEAPEQLHCGVEGDEVSGFTTTLREVVGSSPGQQYLTDPKGGPATAAVSVRADGQTLQAAATAQAIKTKLNSDFAQGLTDFTSAEFALEMVKGVVKVEFKLQ